MKKYKKNGAVNLFKIKYCNLMPCLIPCIKLKEIIDKLPNWSVFWELKYRMLKRINIYQNRTLNKLKSQHLQVNKSK